MRIVLLLSLTIAISSAPAALFAVSDSRQAAAPAAAGPFDPSRDAAKDLKAAIAEAANAGKRVLVDVGGNWCGWCRQMERFYDAHRDLTALRDKYFVVVKINFSPENRNEALLSQYPKISAYPHLFVLDANGRLLQSQNTGELEDGKSSYDLAKFTTFLQKWGTQ